MTLTFNDFNLYMQGVKHGVERIERLTALREKVCTAYDALLSEETQALVGYNAAEEFEQLQAPLENLLAIIDGEISSEKRDVDGHYYGLLRETFEMEKNRE